MQKAKKTPPPFPSKDEILAFINDSPTPVGKREIARAFRISGPARDELKAVLRQLKDEGLVQGGARRRLGRPDALPEVTVIEVSAIDGDGDVFARPATWPHEQPPPRIRLAPDKRAAPGVGDRVLARLTRQSDGGYRARTIKRLRAGPSRLLGVYRTDGGQRIIPAERADRNFYAVAEGGNGGARAGELVWAEALPGRGPLGRNARVIERLGPADRPGSASLIAIHRNGLPTEFSEGALAQAKRAKPVSAQGRADLRGVPLVTIDGADARDFDDAVWAEPDPDRRNAGGWRLIVAIADVAHYVRPGDALDLCARERGNSAYFPDRVVPMLPEALSNDLCSLRPGQDRACVAASIRIDRDGRILQHGFERAIMRSAARLTYEQAQAAIDGNTDEHTAPLLDSTLKPLYGAYRSLAKARTERETLDIDLPERKIHLASDGTVERIAPVARLDSHRLIEEFMIAANIAAAETLERRRQPCMYRVHDAPDAAKLEALRQALRDLGYNLAKGQAMHPRHFNRILRTSADADHARMVHEMVLRTQSQAVYSPDNRGHFGLALQRYAHFTSPIRRYADLLVHRALVGAPTKHGAGAGAETFHSDGEHLSMTERRAMAAERDAADRYVAHYLADRVGARFTGAVTGVNRFGLFVTLAESGADGLIPMRTLPDDYYVHDPTAHTLTGRHSRRTYRLGDGVEVRLAEADPVRGGLLLHLLDEAEPRSRRDGRARNGRGARRRGSARGAARR